MSGRGPDEHGIEHPAETETVPNPDGFGGHERTTEEFQRSRAMLGLFKKPEPPQPPDEDPTKEVVTIVGDSSSPEDQIYADPGLGDRGDPAPSPRPSWIIPAAVAAVVLVSAIGFAATRGTPTQAAAATAAPALPTTTPAPAATATAVATARATAAVATAPAGGVSPLARVSVLTVMIAEGANQNTSTSITDPVAGRVYQGTCPAPLGNLGTTWRLYIRVEGQNVNKGDQIHLVIPGPNLPSELTVPLDDTADTSSNLPGHTVFLGPFPTTGTINISVTADKVNGVPFAFQQSRQTSLNCG